MQPRTTFTFLQLYCTVDTSSACVPLRYKDPLHMSGCQARSSCPIVVSDFFGAFVQDSIFFSTEHYLVGMGPVINPVGLF